MNVSLNLLDYTKVKKKKNKVEIKCENGGLNNPDLPEEEVFEEEKEALPEQEKLNASNLQKKKLNNIKSGTSRASKREGLEYVTHSRIGSHGA